MNTAALTQDGMIRTCSIWRALEVVGDTPTLMLLQALWLGQRRFDQLQHNSGLQKALVSNRLKKLIEVGILEKQPYSERPKRYEYVLTEKGRDIYGVALMMLRWERTWSDKRNSVQVQLTHSKCGQATEPEPLCRHCGQVIEAKDVSFEEGPGLGWMEPIYSRRRQQKNWFAEGSEHLALFTDAAELMGDRWCGLILRSVFTGLCKYDEILKDTAIATNILSDRLNWLQDNGILNAVLYQSNPDRFEYRLTKKGMDYYPVILMLQQWGDKYYGADEGPPVILYHKTCGQALTPFVGCSQCKSALLPQDMSFSFIGSNTVRIET